MAVIGKTEGNGGINDFTRAYFTQSLMILLAARTGRAPEELRRRIPCVLSGGTEGVLSPHYVVLARDKDAPVGNGTDKPLGHRPGHELAYAGRHDRSRRACAPNIEERA